MPTFKKFEAWMECEGKKLEEFQVRQEGDVINCWVPSEAVKTFSVHWSSNTGIMSHCLPYVDGSLATIRACANSESGSCTEVRVSPDTTRSMIFAATVFTEEASGDTPENAHDLGTIRLEVLQKVHTPTTTGRLISTYPDFSNEQEKPPVNEQGKKICGHRVGLGKAIKSRFHPYKNNYKHRPYNPGKPGPWINFCFHYRPRAFLQAQGIIPIPPRLKAKQKRAHIVKPRSSSGTIAKTEPGTGNGGYNDVTLQIRTLKETLAETQEQLMRLEEQRVGGAAPFIKREGGRVRRKNRDTNSRPTAVIDLTGD